MSGNIHVDLSQLTSLLSLPQKTQHLSKPVAEKVFQQSIEQAKSQAHQMLKQEGQLSEKEINHVVTVCEQSLHSGSKVDLLKQKQVLIRGKSKSHSTTDLQQTSSKAQVSQSLAETHALMSNLQSKELDDIANKSPTAALLTSNSILYLASKVASTSTEHLSDDVNRISLALESLQTFSKTLTKAKAKALRNGTIDVDGLYEKSNLVIADNQGKIDLINKDIHKVSIAIARLENKYEKMLRVQNILKSDPSSRLKVEELSGEELKDINDVSDRMEEITNEKEEQVKTRLKLITQLKTLEINNSKLSKAINKKLTADDFNASIKELESSFSEAVNDNVLLVKDFSTIKQLSNSTTLKLADLDSLDATDQSRKTAENKIKSDLDKELTKIKNSEFLVQKQQARLNIAMKNKETLQSLVDLIEIR